MFCKNNLWEILQMIWRNIMITMKENIMKRKSLVFSILGLFLLNTNKKSKRRNLLNKSKSNKSVLIKFKRNWLVKNLKKIRKIRNQNPNPNLRRTMTPSQRHRPLTTLTTKRKEEKTILKRNNIKQEHNKSKKQLKE